jgi:hypothetical protein
MNSSALAAEPVRQNAGLMRYHWSENMMVRVLRSRI